MTTAGERIPVGWIVTEVSPNHADRYSLSWVSDDYAYRTELEGEPSLFAAHDRRTTAYESSGSEQTLVRRTADAVAAAAAQQMKIDLYVTERPYLQNAKMPMAKGVTVCTPADALAFISLYLRTQGDFLIWKDENSNSRATFNKGLFYWVGARELLPAGWRWFAACVAHGAPQDALAPDDDLIYLGGAVFQRIKRVLQARDSLLRAMNCKQDNDVAEDALTALDTCLVFLMGSLDAAARVAHRVLGLPPSNAHHAKWQSTSWLSQVAVEAPRLAALLAAGSPGHDTLTILRLLRNTVHEAGMTALGVGLPGRREGTLANLLSPDVPRIRAAVERQGGVESWGFRDILPGRLCAEPDILLHKLLLAVTWLLNEVMNETPVKMLPGVSLSPADLLPPRGRNSEFGERERQSIRWQLGL